MNRTQLVEQIQIKQSFLCVGLDTDITKIPKHLQSSSDAIFQFNKAIIDATKEYCVSYKINTAFYESQGVKGWEAMEKTVHYLLISLTLLLKELDGWSIAEVRGCSRRSGFPGEKFSLKTARK